MLFSIEKFSPKRFIFQKKKKKKKNNLSTWLFHTSVLRIPQVEKKKRFAKFRKYSTAISNVAYDLKNRRIFEDDSYDTFVLQISTSSLTWNFYQTGEKKKNESSFLFLFHSAKKQKEGERDEPNDKNPPPRTFLFGYFVILSLVYLFSAEIANRSIISFLTRKCFHCRFQHRESSNFEARRKRFRISNTLWKSISVLAFESQVQILLIYLSFIIIIIDKILKLAGDYFSLVRPKRLWALSFSMDCRFDTFERRSSWPSFSKSSFFFFFSLEKSV